MEYIYTSACFTAPVVYASLEPIDDTFLQLLLLRSSSACRGAHRCNSRGLHSTSSGRGLQFTSARCELHRSSTGVVRCTSALLRSTFLQLTDYQPPPLPVQSTPKHNHVHFRVHRRGCQHEVTDSMDGTLFFAMAVIEVQHSRYSLGSWKTRSSACTR